MKNILIAVFSVISVLSLGYIVYDGINDKETTCPECNPATECSKDVCNRLYGSNNDKEPYQVYTSRVEDRKNNVIYTLDVYKYLGSNVKIEDVILGNQKMKLENKDGILYVNDKKIGYAHTLYITDDYIFVPTVLGQLGEVFTHVIDAKGNVINLENNKTYGEFEATNVYLKENGELVAIGGDLFGMDTEVVIFKNNNGKLEITKEKLK